jgi:hypothetical protein
MKEDSTLFIGSIALAPVDQPASHPLITAVVLYGQSGHIGPVMLNAAGEHVFSLRHGEIVP